MEDETNLVVQDAPEVESAPVADEPEVELDDNGDPVEQPEPEEQAPDFAEVEYEGKTHKVPPELKDAILRQADYTRKTQEVAELRKQVETTLQAVQTVSQEERMAEVAVGVIDTQLADYEAIDWDAWEQSDPVSAQRGWRQYQTLQGQRNQAVTAYQQAFQQRTFLTQQETAKRLEQGQRELASRIPDWSADKAAKLVDFGSKSYGFTPADFNSIDDPRVVQVLHDAFMYREQQQKPKAAPKPVPEVKPAAKVGGGKPVLKSLDDRMSAADWVKARNAQLSRK